MSKYKEEADKLRNEWRLQCDAERMEDTPNA